MKLPLTLLLGIVQLVAFSQSPVDSLEYLFNHQKNEEALLLAEESINEEPVGSEEYLEILYYRGFAKYQMGDIQSALEDFDLGLTYPNSKKTAFFWKGKAIIQYSERNYDTAVSYYTRALEFLDRSDDLYIQTLIDLGDIKYILENYSEASQDYLEAKRLFDHSDNRSIRLKQLVLSGLATHYRIQSDFKNAEANLLLALGIAEQIYDPSHPILVDLHDALADVYIGLDEQEKIIDHYKASYDIGISKYQKGTYGYLAVNNNMGFGFMNIDRYDLSLPYLEEVYDDMIKYFPTFDIGVHIVSMNLGINYYKVGKYELGEKLLMKAIDYGKRVYGPKAQSIAESSLYLSFVYEDTHQLDQSLQLLENALKSIVIKEDVSVLDSKTEVLDLLTFTLVLGNRSRVYIKKFLETSDNAYLQKAREDADLSLELLHDKQNSYNDESRLMISEELGFGYYIAAEVNYFQYQVSGDPIYLEGVINLAERSKSNLLRNKMIKDDAIGRSNVPDSLIEKDVNLRVVREELLAKAVSNANAHQAINWDSLILVREEIEKVNHEIGKYIDSGLGYQNKSISALQSGIQPDEALMEFIYQEDVLLSVLITSTEVQIARDSSRHLTESVLGFREELMNVSDTFTTRNELFRALIAPFSEQLMEVSKLTIIPDGPLHYLPFELLGEKDEYLFESMDISYLNYLDEADPIINNNQKLISYAPDFGDDQLLAYSDVVRGDLASIPGAFNEVNGVNEIYGGTIQLKSDATESSFKNVASDYGIIHMATHALVDDANPELSKLVFNLSTDSLNDGYLHAYEIMNMDLNAQLVTLSACNTGYGKIQNGEGVVSLSWAFAYAGVPASVVSLWPASDKSTPELMKYFYQNLKDGQSKDVALNNARKQYLATAKGKARHPFYWGGFVLIGDERPIVSGGNMIIWALPIFLLVVIVGAMWIRKR